MRIVPTYLYLVSFATLAFGQSSSFTGFTSGNLVVSRSVYTGDATTVQAGQPLPPVCPSTASCGTGKATDNGAYPIAGSTNNVWNNDKPDGNFGITSPVFLDQITPAGTLVNTLAIPTGLIVTSFSSKSELSLNLSTDGSAITFMGYIAPVNSIDVSNSNTPGVYDPTNPAGESHFRAVAQVGANGAIQITPTNAYSGNNGRAAILANGLYYMAGNDNNGSGTPANVTSATGVQIATPGQLATTSPQEIGNFSVTQYTNPATGQPFAADKAGKDNNFRGLTIFNNTLYVTKGSGSNGFDTVYQVGTAGTLPTLANAANAPITVLPGFPTVSAKNADVTTIYPFGIWFANANTLYVADEGDGTAADATTSTKAGLQKWSLVNGAWQLDYVLQNGLNLGQSYSVPNYPASLNPATDGLRNITGRVNSDGTVTIWAITSTVSTNGDTGADPNKLVMITDTLANTTAASAANESFTVIRSAGWGEVLRGVCFTPSASTSPAQGTASFVSAASTDSMTLAPGQLAFGFGLGLTPGDPGPILGPLVDLFGQTTVSVKDSTGATNLAPLFYVSPNQVGFEVPSAAAAGTATITVSGGSTSQSYKVQLAKVAPSLFTLNNSGLPAAYTQIVAANGSQTYGSVYTALTSGAFVANPIDVATNQVYLILYGTGIAAAGTANVTVTVNGVNAQVYYAGSGGGFVGLDQVNVLLPASLAGKGNVDVQLTAAGIAANSVQITIQ